MTVPGHIAGDEAKIVGYGGPKDLSAPMASTFVASLPFAAKRPWPPST
jgi:hypothetical protein